MKKIVITLLLMFMPLSFLLAQSRSESESYETYIQGLMYQFEGDYDKALEMYAKIDSSGPVSNIVEKDALIALWRSGKFEEAEEKGLWIVEYGEPDYETYFILAHTKASLSEFDKAIEYAEKAKEIDPDQPGVYFYLGLFYERRGDQKKAGIYYEKYLEKAPGNNDVKALLANVLEREKEYEKAKDLYKEIIIKDKENSAIWWRLGVLYERTNEKQLAEEAYSEALIHESSDINVVMLLNKLGTLAWQDEWSLEGEEYFLRVIDKIKSANKIDDMLITQTLYAYLMLIKRAEEIKDWDKAIEYLFDIMEYNNYAVENYLRIAYLYSKKNKNDKAVNILKKALKRYPSDPDLYYFIGLGYSDNGNNKKAVRYFQEAVSLKTGYTSALYSLGMTYDSMDKTDNAVMTLRTLLKYDPDNAQAANYIGYSMIEKGENLGEAEILIKKALKIFPESSAYKDSLGWLYFKKGEYKEALNLLEEAGKDQIDPVIYFHMGEAYNKLGNYEKAFFAYDSARFLDDTNHDYELKLNECSRMLADIPIDEMIKNRINTLQRSAQKHLLIAGVNIKIKYKRKLVFKGSLRYLFPDYIRIDANNIPGLPAGYILIHDEVSFYSVASSKKYNLEDNIPALSEINNFQIIPEVILDDKELIEDKDCYRLSFENVDLVISKDGYILQQDFVNKTGNNKVEILYSDWHSVNGRMVWPKELNIAVRNKDLNISISFDKIKIINK
ncbi:MAG: tetratricopeptide repeat protein [Elusimicrobiota bacterium]